MSEIISFPGNTLLDIDPQDVLGAAMGRECDAVVIITRNGDSITFATSIGSVGDILLMLETCKAAVLE